MTVERRIPTLRKGSCLPGFLEPRRLARKALSAVVQDACILGVSTVEGLLAFAGRRAARAYAACSLAFEAAISRLIGALLPEPHEEWAVQRARYMTPEGIAHSSDDATLACPPCPADQQPAKSPLHQATGHYRARRSDNDDSGARSAETLCGVDRSEPVRDVSPAVHRLATIHRREAG